MLCGLVGKTRQALHKQDRKEQTDCLRDAIVLKRVLQIRDQLPRLGTRKLHYLLSSVLREHGIYMGRDKLFDLLSDYGMLVRRRKRRKACTTDSNHPFRKYPNLIRDLQVARPLQLWVSDITYISLKGGFCYLSLITDGYSRKIVGYQLYPTLERFGPIGALKTALEGYAYNPSAMLIHHSDRGLQYCCQDYIDILQKGNISISMTEKGDPYENAIAERVNGILKEEFGLNGTFCSFDQASLAIDKAVSIYNHLRPHSSCDYLTPDQAHQKQGLLTSKWRPKNVKQPLL